MDPTCIVWKNLTSIDVPETIQLQASCKQVADGLQRDCQPFSQRIRIYL